MELTYEEKIELQYLFLKGYKYISKSEFLDGDIRVHKAYPTYDTRMNPSCYHQWKTDMGSIGSINPFADFSCNVGAYSFMEIENPLMIEDLIKDYVGK